MLNYINQQSKVRLNKILQTLFKMKFPSFGSYLNQFNRPP